MAVALHYRIYCTTDAKYEYVWLAEGDPAPTTCPVNGAHAIDGAQTAVIDKAGGDAERSEDGVLLAHPQPQNLGYEMCERDFKVVTCKKTQAAAVEDLKIDPVTLLEEPWAGPELKLVDVYKDDGFGGRVACVDQADADTNGILSVFDYQAYDQADGTTKIKYNVRAGALVSDPAILAADKFLHRAYLMVAPDLGQANWVRLFDGYVAGRPVEGELSTESPSAKLLDPSLAPGANIARLFIVHPAGQSHEHILWLLTYRPTGTY